MEKTEKILKKVTTTSSINRINEKGKKDNILHYLFYLKCAIRHKTEIQME
jgi:hypothetical protein